MSSRALCPGSILPLAPEPAVRWIPATSTGMTSMFQAYGLYGHIQANRMRSALLLAGFVALLHALLFSILLIWSALQGGTFEEIAAGAWAQFARSWPVPMAGALIRVVIAHLAHP